MVKGFGLRFKERHQAWVKFFNKGVQIEQELFRYSQGMKRGLGLWREAHNWNPARQPTPPKRHRHAFLGGLHLGQAPLKTLLLMLRLT